MTTPDNDFLLTLNQSVLGSATPPSGRHRGWGTLREGYRQPEREGYGARSEGVVAEGLAVSLDKPLEWAIGFFFGNVELSLELWTVISGISGFDDY